MDTDYLCPRCGGQIPNAAMPGAYPGALSRADNKTEVCSACGWDEAMRQFEGDGVQAVTEWPVSIKYRLPVSFIHSEDKNLLLQFSKSGDQTKKVSVYTVEPSALQNPDGESILVNENNLYVLIPDTRLDDAINQHKRDGYDGPSATMMAMQDALRWAQELTGSFLG